MIKLHITWIGEPKPLETKFGPATKNSIKTTEYSTSFLSFFENEYTKKWKVGDEVEVLEVVQKEYNGKTYYDIKFPKKDDVVKEKVGGLEEKIVALENKIELMRKAIIPMYQDWKKNNKNSDGSEKPFKDQIDAGEMPAEEEEDLWGDE